MTSRLGTALVTGASSGIGATYADRLARRGYDLILVARDADRLGGLADKLAADHRIKADVLRADLSDRADVLKVEARLEADEAVTLFVNNAGIGPAGPLLAADPDYLDRIVDINVGAANRLAVTAARIFSGRKRGAIVNIASAVALAAPFFHGTYAASKAFILALTESLATDLKDTGVQVQAVLPGYTRTEIFDRVGGSMDGLDPEVVMEVGDLVDAALAGLDREELVTMPSLADYSLYETFLGARSALRPHLSLRKPAARYDLSS